MAEKPKEKAEKISPYNDEFLAMVTESDAAFRKVMREKAQSKQKKPKK